MKICLVAAPLIARSGVYNSAVELVTAARDAGHEWSAVIGVSSRAGGDPSKHPDVTEFPLEPSGVRGVLALSRDLSTRPQVRGADLVVSLVPQSDMALSLTGRPWVAYLRGLPWPAPEEASFTKRLSWQALELLALKRAKAVWATTPTLARDTGDVVKQLVPPGIAEPTARPMGEGDGHMFVWAARYSHDKNPELFADALRGTSLQGVMYGSGPLADHIKRYAPHNVTVPGWARPAELWRGARAYVGTSSREAFGRSAVEAAMLRIPPIISSAFGCAEMLYTDRALAREMVIDSTDPAEWRSALERVQEDDALHRRAAGHAHQNSHKLTIAASMESVRSAAISTARR